MTGIGSGGRWPPASTPSARPRSDRGRSTPLDPGLPIEARNITSRIILDACTPYEWENKPDEIFMDRAVLQKVSDRWNEYGFGGTSPVAGMINRLTRPEVKKAK